MVEDFAKDRMPCRVLQADTPGRPCITGRDHKPKQKPWRKMKQYEIRYM